jgi:hypothetical protein
MKKVIGMIVAAVVLITASAAYATGCGGCPSHAKAKSTKPCCVALENVKLTDAQQAKVAALQSECSGISCPVASQKKMAKDLKGVLDAKQYKQWEKACATARKTGATCPSK